MSDIAIRSATPADLDAILHHRRAMFEDMGYNDVAALDAMTATSRPFMQKALDEGWYRGWLVDHDGHVIAGAGVIILPWPSHPRDPQTRRPMIINVYTEPEYRHRALARRLMVACLDWLRQEGFGTVSLHASDHGRHLY